MSTPLQKTDPFNKDKSFYRLAPWIKLRGGSCHWVFSSVLLCLSLGLASGQPYCIPTPSGLVAWWRGENNALDRQGGNSGTTQGNLTYVAGKVGTAFHFDGASGLVALGNTSPFRQSSAITYSFWARFPANGGGTVMGAGTVGGSGFGGLRVGPNGIAFNWTPTSPNSDTGIDSADGITIPSGEWVHLAVSVDFAAKARAMYVNGQPIPTVMSQSPADWIPNGSYNAGQPDFIGARFVNQTNYFLGDLDEATIYSRALTANEIGEIFQAGAVGFCLPPAPNLLMNGSFELPVLAPGNNFEFRVANSLESWIVATSFRGAVQFNAGYRPVSEGQQAVQFETSGDTISQTFATSPGRQYEVSFDLSSFDAGGGVLTVLAGGASATFTATSSAFTRHALTFTASDAQTTLTFRNAGVPAVSYPQLDHVTATLAPLRIAPASTSVPRLASLTFTFSSGTPPYTFSAVTMNSGGSITAEGVYTAGSVAGVDTVRLTDQMGDSVTATVTVTISTPVFEPNNAYGWWRFDGDLKDNLGGNIGVPHGGVSYLSGLNDRAVNFNGSDGYATLPYAANLLPGISSYTLEGWFHTTSGGTIFSFNECSGGGDCGASLVAVETTPDLKLYGYLRSSETGGPGDPHTGQTLDGHRVVADGQWHHFALVRDLEAGRNTLYVDGTEETFVVANPGSSRRISDETDFKPPVCLGAYFGTGATIPSYFFNGRIENMVVYQRALSPSDVNARYMAGLIGNCSLQPLTITCPTPIVAQTTDPLGQLVTFAPTVSNPNGSVTVVCTPGSGSVFPVGTTLVNCSATNAANQSASCSFTVTVRLNGACLPPPGGLISWWRGEDNALDEQGDNDGIASGALTYAIGRVGRAFRFDGATSSIRVQRPVENDFTLAAWIKSSAPSLTGSRFYEGNGLIYSDFPGFNHDFGTTILNGKFAFGIGQPNQPDQTIQSATTVNSGEWIHVAAVRNGTVIRVYVNGVEEAARDTRISAPLNAQSSIDFGGNVLDGRYYNGLMDEVLICNRALSAPEILSIYSAGSASLCLPLTIIPATATVAPGGVVNFTAFGDGSLAYTILQNNSGGSINAGTGAYHAGNQCGVTDTIRVTDFANHTADATVQIVDGSPPTINCPSDIVAECAGPGGTTVSFNVTATDDCATPPTVVCTPASGAAFPSGVTTVNCTATDASGKSTSCSFKVTVRDTTKPLITVCPSARTLSAGANCKAALPDLTAQVTATDVCATPGITQTPTAGTLLQLGVHTVTFRATDAAGNFSTCATTITVTDSTPPIISACVSDQTLEAGLNCQALLPDLTGLLIAADTCSLLSTSQSPPPGTPLTLGAHTITMSAKDTANNEAVCTFTVTVRDTTPPVVLSAPESVSLNFQPWPNQIGFCQPVVPDVSAIISALDLCGPVTIVQDPPAGTIATPQEHPVLRLTISDAANNSLPPLNVAVRPEVPTFRWYGKVRKQGSGEPLSGIPLVLVRNGVEIQRTTTDAEGNYSLPDSGQDYGRPYPVSGLFINLLDSPFLRPPSGIFRCADYEYNFRLEGGSLIRGRIIDGRGLGLARAVVKLEGNASLHGKRETFTDVAGNYEFKGIEPGTYTVTPETDPYVSTPASRALTTVAGSYTANFAAVPAHIAAGRIAFAPKQRPDGIPARLPTGDEGGTALINGDGSGYIWLGPGTETHRSHAISPDGTKIAFVMTNNIWVMNADGSNKRQLTSDQFENTSPTWSPDGIQIAYASRRAPTSKLMIVTTAGGAQSQLSLLSPWPNTISWTPDGTKFAARGEAGRLQKIGPHGESLGSLTGIIPGAGGPIVYQAFPSWSPDSRQLALHDIRGSGIYIADTAASTARRLLPLAGINTPTWAPDGSRIAFAKRGAQQEDQIRTVQLDGSDERNLRSGIFGILSSHSWGNHPSRPTAAGSQVTVSVGNASVSFSSVTGAGTTTISSLSPQAIEQPSGYFQLNGAIAYEVTTTAQFAGPITLCFKVPSVASRQQFDRLRVFHGETDPNTGFLALRDRTILAPDSPPPQFEQRTICARVNSLSPFVMAELVETNLPQAIGVVLVTNEVPFPDVVVQITGDGNTNEVQTLADGAFLFPNLATNVTYTITPRCSGFSFDPPAITLSNLNGIVQLLFLAEPLPPPPLPPLTLSLDARFEGQPTLSWLGGWSDFLLEAADSLTSTNWSPVAELPILMDDSVAVPLFPDGNQRYFRLRRP